MFPSIVSNIPEIVGKYPEGTIERQYPTSNPVTLIELQQALGVTLIWSQYRRRFLLLASGDGEVLRREQKTCHG